MTTNTGITKNWVYVGEFAIDEELGYDEDDEDDENARTRICENDKRTRMQENTARGRHHERTRIREPERTLRI